MSKQRVIEHLDELIRAASVADYDAVTDAVRTELAVLCIQEARKGDFRPEKKVAPDTLRTQFLDHLQKHFVDWEDVKTVFDFTKELLTGARTLAPGRTHPIAAVVLYATWAEHWLNAILLTRAQKLGRTSLEADAMIRSARFPDKVGWLWNMLALPPLDGDHLKKLRTLNSTRNYYLHYRYEGGDPDKLLVGESELAAALVDIEATVKYAQTFELDEILAEEVAVASAAFSFDVRTYLLHLHE